MRRVMLTLCAFVVLTISTTGLGSAEPLSEYELARLLENEAAGCGVEAMASLADMRQNERNTIFTGLNGPQEPSLLAWHVARYWPYYPRVEGYFAFSRSDLRLPEVEPIVFRAKRVAVYRCTGGRWLHIFGPPFPRR